MLAERGLTRTDLDRALSELERTEGIHVRTVVGLNHGGVFGSAREGWRPDLPGARREPFIPLLWLQVLELLGRVPQGSTARFRKDGAPATLSAAAAARPAESGLSRGASGVRQLRQRGLELRNTGGY